MSVELEDSLSDVLPEQGTVLEGVGNEIIMFGAVVVAILAGYVATQLRGNGSTVNVPPWPHTASGRD